MQKKLKKVADKKPEPQKPQPFNERLQDLIDGKVEPPNEMVRYLLEKVKATKKEHDELTQNLTNAKNAIVNMERRMLIVQGANNSYIEDIRTWDKKIIKGDGKPEPEKKASGDA